MTHGIDCPKVKHEGSGHLHGEGDDGPYDVDGITYCGRCHHYLTKEDQTIMALLSRLTVLEQQVAQMREIAHTHPEPVISRGLVWQEKAPL